METGSLWWSTCSDQADHLSLIKGKHACILQFLHWYLNLLFCNCLTVHFTLYLILYNNIHFRAWSNPSKRCLKCEFSNFFELVIHFRILVDCRYKFERNTNQKYYFIFCGWLLLPSTQRLYPLAPWNADQIECISLCDYTFLSWVFNKT